MDFLEILELCAYNIAEVNRVVKEMLDGLDKMESESDGEKRG